MSEVWHKTHIVIGRPPSEETKKKISVSRTGYKIPKSVTDKWQRRGENNPFYGKKHSEETKEKIRSKHKGKTLTPLHKIKIGEAVTGDKGPGWRGGISFEPYCPLFNHDLRRRVRAFFKNKCVLCGREEPKLCVHHVDYDKYVCCNGNPPLFVALCRSCHVKTNHNREQWALFFNEFIYLQYGGKCYYTKQEYENLQKL